MSEINLAEMKYNDLKALAKERGLDTSGTKEELIARLSNTDGSAADNNAGNGDDDSKDADGEGNDTDAQDDADNSDGEQSEPAKPANRKVESAMLTDAQKMKAALDKQPKVSIMIPFDAGENPEQAKLVPFHFNINGYQGDVPRGVYVEVPKQVAELIKERLESEGKIGAQWRIDRSSAKMDALS